MATKIHRLPFNPLQVNTYVLIDEATRETAIIDPGCSNPVEEEMLAKLLEREQAIPVLLLATHLHFDHIWGIPFVAKHYGLTPMALGTEIAQSASFKEQMVRFMMPYDGDFEEPTFQPLTPGDQLHYGENQLEVLNTPGHSVGHATYYNRQEGLAFCGDVVFQGNIGRCDLPGGSYGEMMNTLKNVFIPFPSQTRLFPGHGPTTTIDAEKNNNPYIISQL